MIKGVVCAVPHNGVVNHDPKFVAATGVAMRRVVSDDQDVLTLATVAVQKLLYELQWPAKTIGCLIFVTQTPLMRMPATACLLAGKLGITCPAFDVNMACSGYVYGLWLAWNLGGNPGRILLVTGDVTSRYTVESAEGTRNLFGDAVAATAIEGHGYVNFSMGTEGDLDGHLCADPHIRMDGPDVFAFTMKALPGLIERTTFNTHVDWFLFHQANASILSHIGKKAKVPPEKVPLNLQRYGNTSSASIPLLMCDSDCTALLRHQKQRVAMFGFGAGWSFGGAMLDVGPVPTLKVIEV